MTFLPYVLVMLMFDLCKKLPRRYAALAIASVLMMGACSTTAQLREEAALLPLRTLHEIHTSPEKYHNQNIRVVGCLDFHGSHKYKLWNFALLPIEAGPPNSLPTVLVDGAKIKRKYRKKDVLKETKISDTRSVIETVKDYQWQVEIYGTFLNKKGRFNTGGHIVLDDFFEYTLMDGVIVREIAEG